MIKTAIAILAAGSLVACTSSSKVEDKEKITVSKEAPTEVAETKPEEPESVIITCESCSVQEQMALAAFQKQGITDRYALAALMGNIKQESLFLPDICEGGARIPYENCYTGGYGLIQWTTTGRYDGLGRFAKNNSCNPSTTECQLGYLFTEYQWRQVEPHMKTPGKSIEWYMRHAYRWLGWGIHGNRTRYAYEYLKVLT